MGFADVLKLYLNKTQSTAKELSAASGMSASALSRYRSGKRIPDQEHIEKLICGLVDRVGVVVRRLHVPGGGVKGRVPYSSASFKEGEYPS